MENLGTALPEELPLTFRNANCRKNKQVQMYTGEESAGEIILAVCCVSPTCMKTTHIGYRHVGYSLGQKESMPLFLRKGCHISIKEAQIWPFLS